MPFAVEPDGLEPSANLRLLARERFATPSGFSQRGRRLLCAGLLGDEIAADRLEIATGGRHSLRRREGLGEAGQGRFGLLATQARVGQLATRELERLGRGVLEVARELVRDELRLATSVECAAARDLLHVLVHAEVQEGDQDLATLLGLALQERVELALGKHDRAGERVVVEAHDLLDRFLDLLDPPGQRLVRAFGLSLEHDLRVARDPDGARHPVALAAHLEVEAHREPLGPVAHELLVLASDPRHLSVEREHEGVDQRRLAGPGGPGDGKEVEAVEVECQTLLERREAFELEPQRPQPWASSYTSSNSLRRSSPGSLPFFAW